MNILFLCGVYPQEHKDTIFRNSKRGYQFAAQNLQEAIINGFYENDIIPEIVTFPFLSTFPFGYRKPFVSYGRIGEHYKCVNFINIPFLKDTFNTSKRDVFNWIRQFQDSVPKYIVIYSLTSVLIKVALEAKRTFENVHISVIIPDLPQYMGYNYWYKVLGIKERDNRYIMNNIVHFDCFILLSEAMAIPLSITNRPYCVVEGIFNSEKTSDEILDNKIVTDQETKTVLYSGAILEKYGINTLLTAFSSLANDKYRLIICGDGQGKDLVTGAASKDSRIIFLGKVNHQRVIELQIKADLLINPRTPDGEYTKYSFPSKIMEYFASATPVLMYRLPGIPDQYFDYCYTLEDKSEKALAQKIDKILSLPLQQRQNMGNRAAKFIIENKNAKIQVGKIIHLITTNYVQK